VDVDANPRLIEVLNELRSAKVRAELELREAQRGMTALKTRKGALEAAIMRVDARLGALDGERQRLLQHNALGGNDLDVIVRLRGGQDEVAHANILCPDYDSAVLVPV